MTNEEMIANSKRNRISFKGAKVRTRQEFKTECDINVVLRRYANNGQLPALNPITPTFGDFSEAPDYLSAQLTVQAAKEDFARLPARVRKACGNSPARYLEMVQDPDRKDELVELGLLERMVPEQLKEEPTPPVQGGNPAPTGGDESPEA